MRAVLVFMGNRIREARNGDARHQRLGFKVKDSGIRVQGAGFRIKGLGFRVYGLGFRV
jgi:hypothetical protein